MRNIVILAPYYWPAKKAGGPVKSVASIVELLSKYVKVKVITKATDVGAVTVMDGVSPDEWVKTPSCEVFYSGSCSALVKELFALRRLGAHEEVTFYLNSFFTFKLSIVFFLLRRFGFVRRSAIVILAPRGEFSEGALVLKSLKKKIFLSLSKILNLHSNLVWHATSDEEVKDIRRIFGGGVSIKMSPNMVNKEIGRFLVRPEKSVGSLRMVFLSRVSPKKNLDYALRFLCEVKCDVEFDIYGPQEDPAYWRRCDEVIRGLPPNVTVRYKGAVDASEVASILAAYHLFVLPTLGENFGHAIAEAFQCGCPVLISDQTPWRELEKVGVGWDLPLHDAAAYISAVESMAELSDSEFAEMQSRVKSYIANRLRESDAEKMTLDLFDVA